MKSKKILSLMLALCIALTVCGVGAVAVTAAPADHSGVIYFDAASAGWEKSERIMFYVYEIGGEELIPWGSKRLIGTEGADHIWSYDVGAMGVVPGKQYGLIMNDGAGFAQCSELLLDTTCFGDTVYADRNVRIENPADSNKTSFSAHWKQSKYGTIKQITSIGNVIGETIPANTSAYQMLVNFLASKGYPCLTNALKFNGKDAQTTIDEIAKALGLNKNDVEKAIQEAKVTGANDGSGDKTDWTGKWEKAKSILSDDSGSVTPTQPVTAAPTQAPTQTPTQPATQAPTQPSTQPSTQAPTQSSTNAAGGNNSSNNGNTSGGNTSSTSPKTGYQGFMLLMLLLTLAGVGGVCVSVKQLLKKER
ncbi:hypothetical protein [Ruminococcus sp.]|uniref:hypothetical protein n=1 Tax=Ruminococcus sp. TaxID=41978 RepID=UPI00388E4EDA